MASVEETFEVDEAELAPYLRPRDDIVLEEQVGEHEFTCAEGPFASYTRTVEVTPLDGDRFELTHRVEFELDIPVWGWLFAGPARKSLQRVRSEPRWPWWSPPARLSRRASSILGLLCGVSMVAGYLGTLITQTITFAADEFDSTDTEQGVTLAAVRIGVIFALGLVALADRKGRRSVLMWATIAGCVFATSGAVAPGLAWLGLSQTVARGLATAAIVLIGIMAAEEMPAGARAYAVSVMTMSAALGSGAVLIGLPIADLGAAATGVIEMDGSTAVAVTSSPAWRILYLLPVLAIPGMLRIRRVLPESRRFVAADRTDEDDIAAHTPEARRSHRRRLVLFAGTALLGAMLFSPAQQFMNEFLRDERGYSAAGISSFRILTGLWGGIGIVVGGRLAEVRGRRVVGAVGLAGGAVFMVGIYLTSGATMWLFATIGTIIGAATVPSLGVYGPEMFPTTMRGRANAVITTLGVLGSAGGLLATGLLSDSLGGLGPTMAILALGPLITVVLILAFYPETAHKELEELNPEDAVLFPSAGGGVFGA